MILPDYQIIELALNNGVEPFDAECINPASLDLRLGDLISTPRWYWHNPITRLIARYYLKNPDPRKRPDLYWNPPKKFNKYTLWPGQFVLCHSLETTRIPDNMGAILLSKSSTGRIGLEHLHAGYGDPGFNAQWTWEFCNLAPWPIELIAGQRLTQLVFMELKATPLRGYDQTGRYQGQQGPTPARKEKG
jgi:deoxycytidine triphosphate deaminase